MKRNVFDRLEIDAEHDVSIMFAPIRDPLFFRQEISRKFNNAGASVCHEIITLMIEKAAGDRRRVSNGYN